MKTTLLTFGLLSTVATTMGFLAKIMHWPGANIAMNGGMLLFCCIFAPLWVFRHLSERQLSFGGKLAWIVTIVSGMLFATGGTFKTLHFPGAGIMLVTGMSLFSFVFLPYLFIRTYRNQPI